MECSLRQEGRGMLSRRSKPKSEDKITNAHTRREQASEISFLVDATFSQPGLVLYTHSFSEVLANIPVRGRERKLRH